MADDQTVPSSSGPSIVRNPDGTYTRFVPDTRIPSTPDPDSDSPVLSKDLPLNPKNQTWVRIYLPRKSIHNSQIHKIPLIVYFHGSGFVFLSPASVSVHNFCDQLAAQVDAVVASVGYRLAPEHRLPAAYDDGVEALHWIKATKEPWLTEFADFSNCYLMGTSAGATIAYHAGLRAATGVDDLQPLKINGLILHHPFFGGSERTESEIRLADSDPNMSLPLNDLLWEMSLPEHEDRDHEYCNPMVGVGLENLSRFRELGWRVLVTGRFGDLVIDRQMEFAKRLEEKGIQTVAHFGEGQHGAEYFEPLKAKELFDLIANFFNVN